LWWCSLGDRLLICPLFALISLVKILLLLFNVLGVVATLAASLGIVEPFLVMTFGSQLLATIHVITVVAHSFGIVLQVGVRASENDSASCLTSINYSLNILQIYLLISILHGIIIINLYFLIILLLFDWIWFLRWTCLVRILADGFI